MMEVVMTTGAITRAKLQSNRHQQQTNIQFLQAGCPSCHPTNIVRALKGKTIAFTTWNEIGDFSVAWITCCSSLLIVNNEQRQDG